MDHEKLIECVKQYSFLYDPKVHPYSDNEKKERAWNEIGKDLKSTRFECKKQWNYLRDSFRRAMKKKMNAKNPKNVKKWKFEDEMAFLIPIIKHRGGKFSSFDCDLSNDSFERVVNAETSLSVEQPSINEYPATKSNPQERKHPVSTEKQSSTRKQADYKKITKDQIKERASAAILSYKMQNKNYNANLAKTGEIDLFFNSLAATVKKLSPFNQAMAKSRIFATVSELELEEISKQAANGFQLVCSTSRRTSISSNTSSLEDKKLQKFDPLASTSCSRLSSHSASDDQY